MSEDVTVRLGRQEFLVPEQPLRVMKAAIPQLNKAMAALVSLSQGTVSEEEFDQAILAVSLGLGVPVEQLLELPVRPAQIGLAIQAIVEVNMLEETGPKPPAAVPAADGMTSTQGSSPEPDGAGQTSTS